MELDLGSRLWRKTPKNSVGKWIQYYLEMLAAIVSENVGWLRIIDLLKMAAREMEMP